MVTSLILIYLFVGCVISFFGIREVKKTYRFYQVDPVKLLFTILVWPLVILASLA